MAISLTLTSILLLLPSLWVGLGCEDSGEPFECGMDPILKSRKTSYMHFFLIGILFTIFDVELVITFPLILLPISEACWSGFWLAILSILFAGLVMESVLGSLEWKE